MKIFKIIANFFKEDKQFLYGGSIKLPINPSAKNPFVEQKVNITDLQPNWFYDENGEWHTIKIANGNYWIDGILIACKA